MKESLPRFIQMPRKKFWTASDSSWHSGNTEMWVFAAMLTGRMGRPVLDLTGLKGAYDMTLRLDILEGLTNGDPDVKPKAGDWSSSSIFTDIEKQLGLKLESDRASVDTLVIDHAEKPSEN